MPIIQQLKKVQFSYKSPDDDEYEITFTETKDRKYVEIRKVVEGTEQQPVVYDFDMLCDLVGNLRTMTGNAAAYIAYPPGVRSHSLQAPAVVDHRPEGEKTIEDQVSTAMGNYDPAAEPVQSFSRSEFEISAGVSTTEGTEVAGETPDSWKPHNQAEELKQRAAAGRAPMVKPDQNKKIRHAR
jgi:hypothetical protein